MADIKETCFGCLAEFAPSTNARGYMSDYCRKYRDDINKQAQDKPASDNDKPKPS